MSTQDNFIYTKMQKFDKRRSLNWWEKIVEKRRLKKEIKNIEDSIKIKDRRSRGSLLDYKRSGIPVLQMNLYYKKLELDKLNHKPEVVVRKPRSDKGIKRGSRISGKKVTRELEQSFEKLNSN